MIKKYKKITVNKDFGLKLVEHLNYLEKKAKRTHRWTIRYQ